VAGPGGVLASLTDPLWLISRLGLGAGEGDDAATAAAQLTGRSAGVVDIQQVAFPQHGLLSRAGTADLLDAALAVIDDRTIGR